MASSRWFRFSLRTLLLLSFLVGSAWLLRARLPAWRLDLVLETTGLSGTGRKYKVGANEIVESGKKKYTLFRNDAPIFEFEFFESCNAGAPEHDNIFARRTAITKTLSPDLSKLFVADECHAVLYDLQARKELHAWTLVEHAEHIPNSFRAPMVSFSNDGKRIAVLRESSETITVLNAEEGGAVTAFPARNVWNCYFSTDGTKLFLERNRGTELTLLTGQRVLEMPFSNHSFYATGKPAQFIDASASGVPGSAIADGSGSEVQLLSAENGALIRRIVIPEFDGLSADGRYCYARKFSDDRRVNTYAINKTMDGNCELGVKLEANFAAQGQDSGGFFDSVPAVSAAGDLCVASNPVGDVKLWRISSQRYLGELQPRNITHRPPIPAGYDGPTTLTCMWMRMAHHAIALDSNGGSAGDAIFVEGTYSPAREGLDEIQRDYILRRDHPEEWWGLAYTGEFWLMAALIVAFIGSIVRDRFEHRTLSPQ